MRTWTRAVGSQSSLAGDECGTPPTLETLEMIRRLDWRFLLPDPELGRTGYVGPADGELAKALRTFSDPFVPLDSDPSSDPSTGEAADCDLAVVASRRMQDLQRAIQRLRPGGYLYWEVDRQPFPFRKAVGRASSTGQRAGRFLQDPQRTLERLGIEEIRVGCPFPRIQRPKTILSPAPAAVRHAAGMRNGGTFGLGSVLVLASRLGLLPRLLPTLAVVGRRPKGGATHREGIAATGALGRQHPDPPEAEAPWILLTPRVAFFVVALLLDPMTGGPRTVVKAMGLPGDLRAARSLERETRGLQLAEAAALPHPDSIPAVLGRSNRGATHQVAMSAVPGRALTRREIRRRPEYWTGKATAWLTNLHQVTRRGISSDPAQRAGLITAPLDRLEAHLGPEGTALAHRAGVLMDRLKELPVPTVLEHGDYCPSNLLATPDGRLSVVDWEFAEPHGLPGTDLFFLLASVAMARADDPAPDQAEEAFRAAFRAPDGWARPWIAHYWKELDLPREAATPLFAATWTRLVSRLLWRPDESVVREGGGDLRRGIQRHRYFRFWMDVLGCRKEAGEGGMEPSRADESPYLDLANPGRSP